MEMKSWACEEACIAVYLPKPITSGVNAKGRFGKQDFLEAVQPRLDRNPDSVCDKCGWGRDALPDEIAQDAITEMALHVLVYNMNRAMGILGVAGLIEAIRA